MKSRMRHRRAARSGFTLIEIMLVLVIIAAVAGIAVFSLGGAQEAAFNRTASAQINSLKSHLDFYRLQVGAYPQTLEALHERPSDVEASRWTQVSRDPIKPDPWSRPFEYKLEGDKFQLRSLGPDGQSGTEDDITG